ncbi:MAG TPA: glycosyltransferase N-terminal domain-containing protein [Chthoniobacterales bacterium]|jgi:3-deoxy-D-manno-octulosonic-acid transferase|nr:glycosyltransferase N-terminal domain-containing protein [Chthoniobacterales bacterium]
MLLILYNILLPLALLVSFPFYLRRMLRRGGYLRSFTQRFGVYPKGLADRFAEGGWTWIRAVSVGEIVMALRLIEELKRQFPDFKAVISTTTSTGFALGQQRSENRPWIEIIYNPIDFYPIVKACWQKIRPHEAILIDSDLWPSFLALAKEHRSPVYLANARLSRRSEQRYIKLRNIAQTLFWQNLTTLCAQDPVDAERWKRVGVPASRITVTGSMKYDTENLAAGIDLRFSRWLEQHGVKAARPILLGGSLHPGEEDLLLSGFQLLLTEFPQLFLILVPRHVERTPEIAQLLRARNVRFTLRSEPDFRHDPSVLLVNTTGELRDWYSTATVVVVGKSFYGKGGQNPVEPILASKPVVVGPHMENFQYIVDELRKAGGIVQLHSADALVSTLADLLRNPSAASALVARASRAMAQHQGAIRRTASMIIAKRAKQ